MLRVRIRYADTVFVGRHCRVQVELRRGERAIGSRSAQRQLSGNRVPESSRRTGQSQSGPVYYTRLVKKRERLRYVEGIPTSAQNEGEGERENERGRERGRKT